MATVAIIVGAVGAIAVAIAKILSAIELANRKLAV